MIPAWSDLNMGKLSLPFILHHVRGGGGGGGGLNQCFKSTEDKVTCSRTQHGATGGI